MGKNRTMSPPNEVYMAVKAGIKAEKDKVTPRFNYDNVTDFVTEKMRNFIKQYRLKK